MVSAGYWMVCPGVSLLVLEGRAGGSGGQIRDD